MNEIKRKRKQEKEGNEEMEAQERGRSMERSILIPILLFLHVPWIEEAFMMGYRFMGTAPLLLCVHRPVEMGLKGGKTVRGSGTRFYMVFGGVNVERRGIEEMKMVEERR